MMHIRSILASLQHRDDGHRYAGGVDVGHLGDVLVNRLTALADDDDVMVGR